ncbi:MAG: Txe/YoeB family addiction module toxin [Firmicutes bacterium]|nr:Txe/YoeB family addiction module toxin [Bacillota bacterium]
MQMRRIQWDFDAWNEYLYWQREDRKILRKINQLIKDISRDPFDGIGKPEPLKENLSGFWSRRINDEHRLIYIVEEATVIIISCKGHYEYN